MVRFLVNVPKELHRCLKEVAMAQGQTLNGLIRQILWDWLKDNGKEGWPDASADGRQGAAGLVQDVRNWMEEE